MNSSAQLRSDPDDFAPDFHSTEAAPATLPPFALTEPALKQQVAERLAAHRARRLPTAAPETPVLPGNRANDRANDRTPRPRSARIAAAVAERYAQSPTYRAFLSSEAERSVQQAHAAAEIATINAHAIALAQQQLLADLDQWQWTSATEPDTSASAAVAAANVVTRMHAAAARTAALAAVPLPVHELATPTFTVRLYEDVGPTSPAPSHRAGGSPSIDLADTNLDAEREALDDEITFRKDPWFDEITALEPLPANLIEFPRQLIAARKARPRRAEGPLLDDETGADPTSQLRIFEVEADQLSSAPAIDSVTPDWTSITLAALPSAAPEPYAWGDSSPTLVPQAAPISRRLISGLVDASIIAAGTTLFLATAAKTHLLLTHATTLRLSLPFAAASIAGSVAALTLLYLLLSFTFGDQTAGMRFARIGLCTFADENPTRRAMRRRLLAMFLSAVPLGLGFLWATLDEDRLGWHDRMSRIYQRAY